MMSKRTISRRIYLSGTVLAGYTIHTAGVDGIADVHCNTAKVGHALVKVLRDIAHRHLGLMPATPGDKHD